MSVSMGYKGFLVRGLAVSDPSSRFWTPWADVTTGSSKGVFSSRSLWCLHEWTRGPKLRYKNGRDLAWVDTVKIGFQMRGLSYEG
jgi:hypothetical protein